DAELIHAAGKYEDGVDRLLGLRLDRALWNRDDHDPGPWRNLADLLRDIEARDLSRQQRVDHHDVRLFGRHLRDRGIGLRLHTGDLDFVLAREHRLEVLRDLRQVLDEEDAFHLRASLVTSRP